MGGSEDDVSFNKLLINTVTLKSQAYDVLGDATETSIPGVKCRVMYGNEVITDMVGKEVTSYAKIFFKASQAISSDMRITIDGEDHDRPIIKMSQPQDSKAKHHKEVWVG